MGIWQRAMKALGLAKRMYLVSRSYATDPASPTQLVARYKGWMYACASRNAAAVARTPLKLYVAWQEDKQADKQNQNQANFPTRELSKPETRIVRRGCSALRAVRTAKKIEEVVDHPFLDLVYKVNEALNQFELMEIISLSMDIIGSAYLYVVPDKSGTPQEIWPLLAQFIREPIDDKQVILYGTTDPIKVPKQDVIQIKFGDLRSLATGMGPLEAVWDAANLSLDMNNYEKALLKNHARPDFLLVAPEGTGEAELKRAEANWDETHGGIEQAGKTGILYGGMDVKTLSFSPRELAFQQGRKIVREELAAAFTVPLSKLTVDDVNRANAEAGNYSFAVDSVEPRLSRISAKLNQRLLPLYDSRLFCKFADPVPESRELQLKEDQAHLKLGVRTVNEVRADHGFEPVEWGDKPMPYATKGDTKPPKEAEEEEEDAESKQ